MNQDQLHAHYRQLLAQYRDKRPRGDSTLARQLDAIECAILDNPPPGRVKGLIPERLHNPLMPLPKLQPLRLEDFGIKVLDEGDVMDLLRDPNRTPARAYSRHRLDQNGKGSCAAEASNKSQMTRRNMDGKTPVKLNPWVSYRVTSGGRDNGSTLHDNLAFMQQCGCPSQDIWPRSKGLWTEPSDEAMQDALNYRIAMDGVVGLRNWPEMRTVLARALGPVQFGYTGHSITADDLVDLDRLVYDNSWGEWGDDGHATLHRDRVYWDYGVYLVFGVTAGGL